MTPRWSPTDLDAEFVFNRPLHDGPDLGTLQRLLLASAPAWASRLHIRRSAGDLVRIDGSIPDALAAGIRLTAGVRGPIYRALVERHGRPPSERLVGSAEVHGAGPELVLVVSIDDSVENHLGAKTLLGNTVSLQLRAPSIEGRPARTWIRETFEAWCGVLSPAWGSVRQPAEYWAKVMTDGPSVEAMGRDFGRYLPGLFWLNFLGSPYRQLLDLDLPPSVIGVTTARVDDGLLVQLGDEPEAWDTAGYGAAELGVRRHFGPELFYSKTDPRQHGVVPNWTASP